MSLPGAVLPAWGYHVREEFLPIGLFFLATGIGLLLSNVGIPSWLERRGVARSVASGAATGAAALVWLALTGPPVAWPWRLGGFLLLGLAAGVLNRAAFQSIAGIYDRDPAATVNLAGVLFVLGCLAMALFISSAFYVYTVGSTLLLAAFIPGFAAGRWTRRELPPGPPFQDQSWRQVWADMKSPAAVLFSVFLFFQFGNEWTVAGWLALLLVRRVGISPDQSLQVLAAYWLAILLGRVAAQWLLPRAGHGKLLFSSAVSAMLGSLLLMATNNPFGAWLGTLLLGGGFAMIYPLTVEKIGGRFPNYHPGVFNGLFSLAVTGGLLAPAIVSVAAHFWGIWVIMALPLVGTIAVLILTLLIWLEARLTGSV